MFLPELGAMMYRRSAIGRLLAVIAVMGCTGERIVTQNVLEAGITVQPRVTSSLLAAAEALGWKDGAIPGATVVARGIDDSGAGSQRADTVVTDSAGAAHFPSLAFAQYSITVSRTLTDDERRRAAALLGGVYALEGVTTTSLDPSATAAVSVTVGGVDRGSLLISEIFPADVFLSPGNYYIYADYVELYNNADTTITLARKLFIDGFYGQDDYPDGRCANSMPFMGDPAGLWAEYVYRFPDDAEPLLAGHTVVMATDAIDHRQFGKSVALLDLSRAEYEFRGPTDTHNPLAKEMISIGPRDGGMSAHGWRNRSILGVRALAQPLDIDTLPRRTWVPSENSFPFVRIPTGALIDVLQWRSPYKTPYPPCPKPQVATEIDRDEVHLITSEDTLTLHRRARYTLPSGQVVLQHSRNSGADFFAARGNPGVVP